MSVGFWLNVAIGAAVTIAATVVVTILVTRHFQRQPILRYGVKHEVLVSPEESLVKKGLGITFNGSPVELVSRSLIAVWSGKGTLRGADIARTDPLRIGVGETSLLSCRVLSQSREQIGLSLNVEPDGVYINFEFLEEVDGFLLELISQERRTPPVVGTVIEAKTENARTGNKDESDIRAQREFFSGLLSVSLMRRLMRRHRLTVLWTGVAMMIGVISLLIAILLGGVDFLDAGEREGDDFRTPFIVLLAVYLFALISYIYLIMSAKKSSSIERRFEYDPTLSEQKSLEGLAQVSGGKFDCSESHEQGRRTGAGELSDP